MKKTVQIFGLLVLIFLALFFSLRLFQNKVRSDLRKASIAVSPITSATPTPFFDKARGERSAIFLPYWALESEKDLTSHDEIIYFGISPTRSGIDTSDSGFKNIDVFVEKIQNVDTRTLLTLRMLDSKENFAIIENKNSRQKVIAETISIAKEHNFDGIVLDLEVSAIPFESVVQNISAFVSEFSEKTKSEDLEFQVAMYGDTFYRLRPFNVKAIGGKADRVLIMAYDFHKSRGNPGPNFPLSGRDTYGYDFQKMIEDFSSQISPKKLTVIFGMFGYDWEVDDKKKATGHGKALSYLDAKTQFIDSCDYVKCDWQRERKSGEVTVSYTDDEDTKHIVWFEDPQSTRLKQDFLKTRGISSYAFWAYSYF